MQIRNLFLSLMIVLLLSLSALATNPSHLSNSHSVHLDGCLEYLPVQDGCDYSRIKINGVISIDGELFNCEIIGRMWGDMATEQRYEYSLDDDGTLFTYGSTWRAQTFTVGYIGDNEDHYISKVSVVLYRKGTPGDFTMSIRTVDGDGKPTGGDIISETFSANGLTTDTAGEWVEISFSGSMVLYKDTTYAFVMSAPAGDINNAVGIRMFNDLSPPYLGGGGVWSGTSGITWGGVSSYTDFTFEIWGTPTPRLSLQGMTLKGVKLANS